MLLKFCFVELKVLENGFLQLYPYLIKSIEYVSETCYDKVFEELIRKRSDVIYRSFRKL